MPYVVYTGAMLLDRYILKDLLIAFAFVTLALTAVIFLTQSLKFLGFVVESGASGGAFWMLIALALPRFLEVILPVALTAATIFIYHRMTADREITAMRTAGLSSFHLVRPALVLSVATALLLWALTIWLTPASLTRLQQMRQVIGAQVSTLLFREGVFNTVMPGVTVFIRNKTPAGELQGLMIHDNRPENETPVTVLAKQGVILDGETGPRIFVKDGTRQTFNKRNNTLERLTFAQYTLDLPADTDPVQTRWREPDERSFVSLLKPDPNNDRDRQNRRAFTVEAHRRLVTPLLAPTLVLAALALFLLGAENRGGNGWRVAFAVTAIVVIQGLFLAAFNLAQKSDIGLVLMYGLVVGPCLGAAGILRSAR